MIQAATEKLRQEAAMLPETATPSDEASAHNQLAWIVGNTTGDMNEALEHALRAVELSPESGAYLDTLAHVYFYGMKDYKKGRRNPGQGRRVHAPFRTHTPEIRAVPQSRHRKRPRLGAARR